MMKIQSYCGICVDCSWNM